MSSESSQDNVCEIERRDRLSYDEFVREYLYPHRPVIIKDGLEQWSANGKWTPEFFRSRFGDKTVRIDREYRLREYIDLVEASTPDKPAPYLFHLHLDEHFPELLADFSPLPKYLTPNWLGQKFLPGNVGKRIADHDRPGVFIGGVASSCARLHYDYQYHSFSFQLFGRKRFWLYPAAQTKYMYPEVDEPCLSQIRNVERPDLAGFPEFVHATPQTCELQAGEFIFIPGGFWHTTRMLSVSISISINTANASNWPAVVRQLRTELMKTHPVMAAPFAVFLRSVGAWKALRDSLGR